MTAAAITWRTETHDILPSTSDLCVQRAKAGEPGGLAVRAGCQTSGRGSRGRAWDSLDGNLALSVLLRPDSAATDAGAWALAAGAALHTGLRRFQPEGLSIKWPNDILLRGRKVAGLLVDAAADGQDLSWVVIGMGANLRSAPPGPDPAPVALGPHDPADVAEAVLDRLAAVLRAWHDDGFAAVRAMWLAAAHPPGTKLRVRNAHLDVSGTFDGLSSDGALLLRTRDGVRTFSTGEVLLR